MNKHTNKQTDITIHSHDVSFLIITENILEINNRGDSRINEGKRGGWGEKWEYLQTDNQVNREFKHWGPL